MKMTVLREVGVSGELRLLRDGFGGTTHVSVSFSMLWWTPLRPWIGVNNNTKWSNGFLLHSSLWALLDMVYSTFHEQLSSQVSTTG